ncbi:MAG: MFS transporter [Candidatus Binatia bacterium]
MATNGIAPAVGEVIIAHAGFPAYFVTAAVLGAAAFVLTATLVTEPPRDEAMSVAAGGGVLRAMREAIRRGRLGPLLAATGLFGVGINSVFVFVAPYTRRLGLERAGPFFAAYAGASIAVRIVGRRLPDRVGPHRMAIPAFALYAAALGSLCLLPHANVLALAGAAGGVGHGTLFPVLNALAVTRTPVWLHGTVVSLVTGTLDLGAVVGTPVCGAIADWVGYPAMYLTVAVASLGGLALMMVDRRRVREGR